MKKSLAPILAGVLLAASQAYAASVTEMCATAGNVVRDSLLRESLRVAFNESIDWRDPVFDAFPKSWKELVTGDVERLKPDAIAAAALILKGIPVWNQEGYDGKAKARAQIIKGLEGINEAYKARCLKLLDVPPTHHLN